MARRKRAEYRLRPAAEGDLEAIWLYTAEQWSGEQADRYVDGIIAMLERIAANPGYGTACDHVRQGYRRSVVGRHVIFYRTADYGIEVVRILHGRMDASRHL